MRHRDGDAAGLFLGRVVDGVETAELHLGIVLAQHLGDGRRQSGLAVIDVPDGPDIDVRLGTIKFFLCHLRISQNPFHRRDAEEPYSHPFSASLRLRGEGNSGKTLEPLTRIELVTSSLPRTRSTN